MTIAPLSWLDCSTSWWDKLYVPWNLFVSFHRINLRLMLAANPTAFPTVTYALSCWDYLLSTSSDEQESPEPQAVFRFRRMVRRGAYWQEGECGTGREGKVPVRHAGHAYVPLSLRWWRQGEGGGESISSLLCQPNKELSGNGRCQFSDELCLPQARLFTIFEPVLLALMLHVGKDIPSIHTTKKLYTPLRPSIPYVGHSMTARTRIRRRKFILGCF
jgi:hypothetical protein